jgi:hypothetical protein
MSNYNKSTNFAAKDNLADSDPGKIIKGSEFDTEFNEIVTAVNSKANISSPALTGTPTAPTASLGTTSTQLATTEFVQSAVDVARTYSTVQTFKDTTFSLIDNTDATKKIALELSGITTATTRTLTVADKNGTIALTSDLPVIDPLNANSNSYVSGSYSVTTSATITITATNTFSASQKVFITFTNITGTVLTSGEFTIVSATGSNFVINYGSSVTSTGTVLAARYGYSAIATPAEVMAGTDNLKYVTPSNLQSRLLTRATAQATTSGTAILFSNIPSWAKRITVMFNGVSTSGTSLVQVQIGSGSVTTTGYLSTAWQGGSGDSGNRLTSGFCIDGASGSAGFIRTGQLVLTNISGNIWIGGGTVARRPDTDAGVSALGGNVTLAGVLDRLNITTVNGTDTFDAGSINILYE